MGAEQTKAQDPGKSRGVPFLIGDSNLPKRRKVIREVILSLWDAVVYGLCASRLLVLLWHTETASGACLLTLQTSETCYTWSQGAYPRTLNDRTIYKRSYNFEAAGSSTWTLCCNWPRCLSVGGLSCWLAMTGFVEGLLILSTLSVGAHRAFPT